MDLHRQPSVINKGTAEQPLIIQRFSGISGYLDFRQYWVWHLSILCFLISLYQPFFLSCIPFIIFLRVLPLNGVFDYGAVYAIILFFLLSLAFHFRVLDVVPTPVKNHNVFLFNQYISGSFLVTCLLVPYLFVLIINETFRFFSKSEIIKNQPPFSLFEIFSKMQKGSKIKASWGLFFITIISLIASYAAFSKPVKTSLRGYIELFKYRDGLDEERQAALILTSCFMFLFFIVKGSWIPFLKRISDLIKASDKGVNDHGR